MRPARAIFLFAVIFLLATNVFVRPVPADDVSERAHKLHFSSFVIDTHDDTTHSDGRCSAPWYPTPSPHPCLPAPGARYVPGIGADVPEAFQAG